MISISPKECAGRIKQHIKDTIKEKGVAPSLAIINTLETPATSAYIKGKLKDAGEVGIEAEVIKIDEFISIGELLRIIKTLPHNAIIVQLPLHPRFVPYQNMIIDSIPMHKDVDGLTRDSKFIPCTPLGIITFLNYNNINLDGKNVVIVGRSKLVGEPLAKLFLQKNATVTLCHSHTKNIQWHTTMADIVVCAAGRAKLLTKEHFLGNRSQIVIDVGINREEGKLIGDVDPAVSEFVNYLTPVPGGVGLLTRAALMENVLKTRL